MAISCLVCREINGEVLVPGGLLQDADLTAVFHLPTPDDSADVYLGHLLLAPRRHVAGFADLNENEASAIGLAISRWSRALEGVGAEHVYLARIGHGVDHLHVHLLPRWPGTPIDVPWNAIDEWSGARRGGYDVASELAERLRSIDSR